jgi:hypothetical protein
MPDATRSQPRKLLDEVRNVLRLHHYSIHTERSYVEWIIRFVRVHGRRSRDHLFPAEPQIEAFLTDLAVHGHMAPTAQLQAMPALVCLDTHVPNHAMKPRRPVRRREAHCPDGHDPRSRRRAFGHSRHGQLMVKLVSQRDTRGNSRRSGLY